MRRSFRPCTCNSFNSNQFQHFISVILKLPRLRIDYLRKNIDLCLIKQVQIARYKNKLFSSLCMFLVDLASDHYKDSLSDSKRRRNREIKYSSSSGREGGESPVRVHRFRGRFKGNDSATPVPFAN